MTVIATPPTSHRTADITAHAFRVPIVREVPAQPRGDPRDPDVVAAPMPGRGECRDGD